MGRLSEIAHEIDGLAISASESDNEECPICGGEGFLFDCFDGCCLDAGIGCDDCTYPCRCQAKAVQP